MYFVLSKEIELTKETMTEYIKVYDLVIQSHPGKANMVSERHKLRGQWHISWLESRVCYNNVSEMNRRVEFLFFRLPYYKAKIWVMSLSLMIFCRVKEQKILDSLDCELQIDWWNNFP